MKLYAPLRPSAAVAVRLLSLVVALLIAVSLPLAAQTTATTSITVDYEAWNTLANRAERVVENPYSSEQALNDFRAQVVEMRAQFSQLETSIQDRLTPLRDQITALGPVPAEGQTEAPELTVRRTELSAQLAEREAPLRTADEGFARADSIVRSIDRELRERQANALMTLGPTPLNPANWLEGVTSLLEWTKTLTGEVSTAWQDPAYYEEMISDLPITLGLLALAALLLFRGRHWMEHLTLMLLQSTAILRGRAAAAFLVSLSQLVVPFLGLTLLTIAIRLTRMTGPRILELVDVLVPAGMALFTARWLSLHLFPVVDDPQLSMNLSTEHRRRARGIALILGLLAGLQVLYVPFLAQQGQTEGARAVLIYPLVVLAAFTLFRLARTLRLHQPRKKTVDEVEVSVAPFFDRMQTLGTRVLMLMSVLAPILGAAGYMAAALQVVFPAILSLGLIGLVLVLHRLVTAIYVAIVGNEEAAAQGLVPALAGLMLSMLAIPPLALIWGARDTDLIEIYTRFSDGISLGGARLSPTTILWFLAVFGIGYMVTRALQGALGSSVLPKTSMEKGAQKAIVSGVGYVGITTAALIAFSTAGIDLSGLAIVAGALSVGIGFGLQNIVSNFVSGIILLIERPVSEGDWVEVGTTSGIIQRISVRSTMIETFDRSKVIVPNADLISGAVTNYTKSSKTGRMIVPVGVAYGTDTRKVESILRELVEAEPLVVLDPKPGVLFLRFGADAMEFEVRAILRDVNYKLSVASELNHKIAIRFAQEGIEIPYAQRDIWLRNPEALNPQPREATPPPAATRPEARPDRDTADSAGISPDQTDTDFREETR